MIRATRKRWHQNAGHGLRIVRALSVAFALIISLSPCCHLFSGLIVPAAYAAVDPAPAGHDHHDQTQQHDHGSGPTDQNPCGTQLDQTFVPPIQAMTATTLESADAELPVAATSPQFPKYWAMRAFSTHGPPPLTRQLYLRFLRFLE